jgi:small subunit ribosomal protein S24e
VNVRKLESMELKILEEKENHLLGRKEIRFEMSHSAEASPAKANVVKELAVKYGVPEDHVVIDYIFTSKGVASSEVHAKIYNEKPKMKHKKTKEAKAGAEKDEAQAGKPA